MRPLLTALTIVVAAITGCSSTHTTENTPDSGVDGGTSDSGVVDSGAADLSAPDLGVGDAGIVDGGADADMGGFFCMPNTETAITVSVTSSGVASNCDGAVVVGTLIDITAEPAISGVVIEIGEHLDTPSDYSCFFHVSNVGTDLVGQVSSIGAIVHADVGPTSLLIRQDAVCDCLGCPCGFETVFYAADLTLVGGSLPVSEFTIVRGPTDCTDTTGPHAVTMFKVGVYFSAGSLEDPSSIASEGETVTDVTFPFFKLRSVRSHVIDFPPSQSAAWVLWKLAVDG